MGFMNLSAIMPSRLSLQRSCELAKEHVQRHPRLYQSIGTLAMGMGIGLACYVPTQVMPNVLTARSARFAELDKNDGSIAYYVSILINGLGIEYATVMLSALSAFPGAAVATGGYLLRKMTKPSAAHIAQEMV